MTNTFSESFQRKVLRLLIQDTQFTQFLDVLNETYFRGTLAELFKTVYTFYSEHGRPPSEVLLEELVSEDDDLSNELELCLAEELPPVSDAIIFVREFITANELYEALTSSATLLQHGRFHEIGDRVSKALEKGLIGEAPEQSYFDDHFIRFQPAEDGITTPWPTVNRWLDFDGTRPGELVVLLAPHKGFKSLGLMHAAVGALIARQPVLVISLEMSRRVYTNRFDRMFTGMNWVERALKPDEFHARLKRAKQLTGGLLYIQDYPAKSITCTEVESQVLTLERMMGRKLGLLVVDYGTLMAPVKEGYGDVQELGSIYAGLQAIGKRRGVGVWSAAQTGRDTEDAEVIKASKVWRSLEIVQVADYVITIGGKLEDRNRGRCNLFLAASRNTPGGELLQIQISPSFWMHEMVPEA